MHIHSHTHEYTQYVYEYIHVHMHTLISIYSVIIALPGVNIKDGHTCITLALNLNLCTYKRFIFSGTKLILLLILFNWNYL